LLLMLIIMLLICCFGLVGISRVRIYIPFIRGGDFVFSIIKVGFLI
jgi:hypothetical protein